MLRMSKRRNFCFNMQLWLKSWPTRVQRKTDAIRYLTTTCNENQARRRSPHNPTIDKALRIATPMRKASWTKRFAEGWGGAAGCEWRWWQRWGGLEGMGRRCEREIAPKARSVREAAPSLAGRR